MGGGPVFVAGALGGVMVVALGMTAQIRSAAGADDTIALHRPASGAKIRARLVVKAVPQIAPRAHNRPLCNRLAEWFCQAITGHPYCRRHSYLTNRKDWLNWRDDFTRFAVREPGQGNQTTCCQEGGKVWHWSMLETAHCAVRDDWPPSHLKLP